jgi:hypothetical protein
MAGWIRTALTTPHQRLFRERTNIFAGLSSSVRALVLRLQSERAA